MPLGPDELIQYFTVKYWVVADIEDSADVGDLPDRSPINGYITFTPNLDKNAPVVKYPTALDPDTGTPLGFELAPLKRKIKVVNGRLSHNETGYVKLEANSAWANPPEWSWHVEFDLSTSQGKVNRAGFDIAAVAGSTVDLTVVSPVSSGTGQQIIQGPQGFSIDGFSISGSNFYASLNDPMNTQLGPVSIPAVVEAQTQATNAAASATAAATSATNAGTQATNAASSATAAANSATAAASSATAAQGYVNAFGVDIGTVTTGAPGSSASATVTGTAPSYHLNLTIPRGDVGPTGPSAPDATGSVKGILQFGGDLAGSTAISQTIANGAITGAKIANDTITATQIAADAITASELADNAVDTTAIADLAVTGTKIANDTITATQIAANAITASELADDSVDTNAIQNLAVTAGKIANTTITNAQISATAAIAASKTLVPASFFMVSHGGARAVGTGDLTTGAPIMEPMVIDEVIYWFDTADASGSTTVKLQKQTAGTTTDITGTSMTITAANQTNVSGTDSSRRTGAITQALAAGDRLLMNITAVGTTPGKVMGAWIKAHWA